MLEDFTSMDIDKTKQIWFREESESETGERFKTFWYA